MKLHDSMKNMPEMNPFAEQLHFLSTQCAADVPLPLALLQKTLQLGEREFSTAKENNILAGNMVQLPVGLILLPDHLQSAIGEEAGVELRQRLIENAADEAESAMHHHSRLDQLSAIREIGPHLLNLATLAQDIFHPRAIGLWIAFGDYLFAVGKFTEALQSYRHAVEADNQTHRQTDQEKIKLTKKLGDTAFALNSFNDAELYYLSALILVKQTYRKEKVEQASFYENLGKTAFKRGDIEKAIRMYQKTLEIEVNYGKNANLLASRHNNLGRVFQANAQFKLAIEHFEEAAKLWENEGASEHHVNQSLALKNLGTVYQELGDLKQAQTYLESAIRKSEAHYGADHSDIGRDANILALILQEQGKFEEALAQFRRALRIDIQTFGMNHPEVALTMNNMGMLFLDIDDRPRALETIRQAHDIVTQCTREDHPCRLQIEENLRGLEEVL